MCQVDGMRVTPPKPKISSMGNKERERRKEEERKIPCPTGLRRSNGKSSADQGVSSSTLQEVGVSPTLVPFRLKAMNGHIVQSQPWG